MTRPIFDLSGWLCLTMTLILVGYVAQGAPAAEVTSVLRVRQDAVAPQDESRRSYLTYKETLAALIKSPFVIEAAIRDPQVREMQILRRQKDPSNWVLQCLQVDSPANSELIQITLVGGDTDSANELSPVLDAVVQAFMEEIVNKERLENVAMLNSLRKRYKRNYDDVQKKTDAVQTLAEQLGSLNSDTIKAEAKLRRFRYRRLYKGLDRLEQRLLDLQLEKVAASLRDDDEAKQRSKALSAQSEFLAEQMAKLNQSIESAIEQYRELHGASGELEARLQELSGLRQATQQVRQQIQALEIEIEAPSPITVIQLAR